MAASHWSRSSPDHVSAVVAKALVSEVIENLYRYTIDSNTNLEQGIYHYHTLVLRSFPSAMVEYFWDAVGGYLDSGSAVLPWLSFIVFSQRMESQSELASRFLVASVACGPTEYFCFSYSVKKHHDYGKSYQGERLIEWFAYSLEGQSIITMVVHGDVQVNMVLERYQNSMCCTAN
ncbi:hypothetical protein STEG23_028773, partial [Scotinomys teguina]